MIYIAGKISDEPIDVVEEKFQKAENRLHCMGVKVINPLKLGIPHSWTWDEQLAKCLEVIEQRATGIFLLDDWAQSKGAKREFLKVCELNNKRPLPDRIQIYFEDYMGFNELEMDAQNGYINCLIPQIHD
jgi:hypothetical protein